jgi:hypothetical protein
MKKKFRKFLQQKVEELFLIEENYTYGAAA